MDYLSLNNVSRILFEVNLRAAQGRRIQPTGFPNLGAATYRLPESGRSMLLVESAQSMANRLEIVMWDYENRKLISELDGLPYVELYNEATQSVSSSSILEAHRLSSPYLLVEGNSLYKTFEIAINDISQNDMPVDIPALSRLVFKYDPNSVLHGVFIANKLAGGRLRLQRLISAFIEAEDVETVESGGVKNDILNPKGPAKEGQGHVPFHRTEYVATTIKAYFNLDLACLRSYGLDESAEKLLISLALWKIRRFLATGLRLRTACDLEVDSIVVKTPDTLEIPSEVELLAELRKNIYDCKQKNLFAEPTITRVIMKTKEKAKKEE